MEAGDLLHTLSYPGASCSRGVFPTWVDISFPTSYIVIFYGNENVLLSTTVNAKAISHSKSSKKLSLPGTFCFGGNGRYLFAGTDDGAVICYDVNSLQEYIHLEARMPVGEPIVNLEFIGSNTLIVSTNQGKTYYTRFLLTHG
mmetsp:Transcript_7053/g.8045  ORF Transcript_7053/g.8045 Transcript_7053/m.8045 type:complete len:143 (+) Transcript_7053:2-430(+)